MGIRNCATALITAIVLSACTSSVESTRVETPGAEAPQRYARTLVIAGGENAFLKEDAEEAIVAALARHGIEATVGIRVIGPRTKINREVVEPYIASGKYDSVLFVRATLADPGEVRSRGNIPYDMGGTLDEYYDTAMLGYLAGQPIVGADFTALATLFDVAERKAVWSEDYTIANPGNADRVIAKLSRQIERGLEKAGFLK